MEITIETLLNPSTKPGDLFPQSSKEEIRKMYKMYCLIYHPDVCKDPRAGDAFAKLTMLYNMALKNLDRDSWEKTNYIEFHLTTGKTIQITYQFHSTFELGEYYVTSTKIIYVFDFSKKKYYNNYKKKIKYANAQMKKVFARLVPDIVKECDTSTQHLIIINKPSNAYPLKCLIENYFDNNIPDKHLAWMISRLMNLACFLKYNGLVSNGIDVENLFVAPDEHSLFLFGGWWYTVPEDQKMIGTTKGIYDVMSPKVKADKVASSTTDVESIKAFGRKYLQVGAPAQFKDFLNSGSSTDTFAEMGKWDKALVESYGKRKFIKLDETEIKENIYKKES